MPYIILWVMNVKECISSSEIVKVTYYSLFNMTRVTHLKSYCLLGFSHLILILFDYMIDYHVYMLNIKCYENLTILSIDFKLKYMHGVFVLFQYSYTVVLIKNNCCSC